MSHHLKYTTILILQDYLWNGKLFMNSSLASADDSYLRK